MIHLPEAPAAKLFKKRIVHFLLNLQRKTIIFFWRPSTTHANLIMCQVTLSERDAYHFKQIIQQIKCIQICHNNRHFLNENGTFHLMKVILKPLLRIGFPNQQTRISHN